MGRKHVFISYRSHESDFAVKLAKSIHIRGISIWMDQLDGIQPGVDWIKALTQGIDESAAMVPILSPDYVISKYCMNELQRADSKGIPLFPIMLKEVDLPLELQRTQYVDFRDKQDFDLAVDMLVLALKAQTDDAVDETAVRQQLTPIGVEIPLRAIDSQIKYITHNLTNFQATADKAKQRKIDWLQRRLEMATRRFEAATNQLLSDLNAAHIPQLELQVELLNKEIIVIEQDLSQLQS